MNIVDEEEKVDLCVKLLIQSMSCGVHVTKRLFISPDVWVINGLVKNKILQEAIEGFEEISSAIERIVSMSKYNPTFDLLNNV